MPIYRFFDSRMLARRNLIAPHLRLTYPLDEAWQAMQQARSTLHFRPAPEYLLP